MKYFPFLQMKNRNKIFLSFTTLYIPCNASMMIHFKNEERQIILQLALQTWTNEKISKHPNEN
jgi:hypothetical protein